MKRLLGLAILLTITTAAFAQKGYKIKIHVDGFRGKTLFLSSYYGDKIKRVDTAKVVKPGVFVFEGAKPLVGGIYMAVDPMNRKLFEFIVSRKQHFGLTTDTANYLMDMRVSGSRENSLFFHYLKSKNKFHKQNSALEKRLESALTGSASYKSIEHKLDSLKHVVANTRLKLIKAHPSTFFATLLRAMEPEKVLKNINPSDSSSAYHYERNHFWDNFDPGDPRLFRTPFYAKKVNYYFNYLVPPQADSIDHAIDVVVSKSKNCRECISYLVWKFTEKYELPKYIRFEKVFVHLVDRYFSKDSIQNATPSILKMLKDRANAIRPNLPGKMAPDLILMDTSGQYINFRSLHDRFVLLLFWNYRCSACRWTISQLKPFYKKYAKKYDLQVYAININHDLDNWKAAVRDWNMPWINVNGTQSIKGNYIKTYDIMGTPQFFLLDKDGKIIAKYFSVSQLNTILIRNLN